MPRPKHMGADKQAKPFEVAVVSWLKPNMPRKEARNMTAQYKPPLVALEKKVTSNQFIANTHRRKNQYTRKMIKPSEYLKMPPANESIVRMTDSIVYKRKYVVNQDMKCEAVDAPIIFNPSFIRSSFSRRSCFESWKNGYRNARLKNRGMNDPAIAEKRSVRYSGVGKSWVVKPFVD
mmetsp:Transcript_33063/g.56102  ORF Transcript_33063/g.56102 Transcript_33063/m.56102 type:complete len:177 (+) Transcript_33063:158-688(+)